MSSAVTGPDAPRTGALATGWEPHLLSVPRVVAALIFLEHGARKPFGFPPRMGGALQGPAAFSPLWFAAILELVGGPLLLAGLFTGPVAFVLSGEMAFAYRVVHAPHSPFPALNGGDAAILYCFVLFYLAAAGGGPWCLDAARSRRGRPGRLRLALTGAMRLTAHPARPSPRLHSGARPYSQAGAARSGKGGAHGGAWRTGGAE